MTTAAKITPFVQYSVKLYLSSDELETTVRLQVTASEPLPKVTGDMDLAAIVNAFGLQSGAAELMTHTKDWRPATLEEAREYEDEA